MKSIVTLFALLFVMYFDATAQYAIPPQMRSQVAVEALSRGATDQVGNVVYGLAAPAGQVIGDEYLDANWNVGNVMMRSGELFERYQVRYDLKNQSLEIQSMSGVKLIDSRMLRSVVWRDELGMTRYFVNAAEFKLEESPLIGILEVLIDGPVPLFRRHTLAVKQPDYNAALDVGSRDTKIFKKSSLFYSQGNVLTEVKGKKWPEALFGENAARMEGFIDVNNLSIKKDGDVIQIFEEYNKVLEANTQP
jgi:hypothetical protein